MRELKGISKLITAFLVALWSLFLIYTALTIPLHSLLQGGISLSFGLALVFLLYPISNKRVAGDGGTWAGRLIYGTKNSPSALDILFILFSVGPCLYVMLNWEKIARAVGQYEDYQLVMGAVLAVLLLEGTRRALGYAIPIVVFFFLAYGAFGQHIPGFFGHAGYSIPEILYQAFLMTEGIWGLLTDMTSRVIALFIIFGPVLFAAGVGKSFMDISKVLGGRTTGGAGQIAVVSSAFFGMLSGSSVANVATTGAFTIPTMKKLGYKPELSGAIEASASSGGQIMPPIMGAGAFIIAEFLNISYLEVMIAALIPAIIYFVGIWAGVYVEAKRDGLGRLPQEMIPKLKEVFAPRQVMMFFIPVGLLMYLLFLYLPPQMCAAWALISIMVLFIFFGSPLSFNGLWNRAKQIAAAYYQGVTSSLAWLMVMMSCVQMAVTMISLSGFGVKLSEVIMALADVNIILALLATMVASMLLGMGMTTTAAYVIAAAVLAPALTSLGIAPLAGHLFIFWFAIKSGLTPPVCIAVFTAAAISGGNWLRLAWIAMRLGIGGYIMPFFFVFFPVFLMQGTWQDIAIATALAIVAMFPLQAFLMGYWLKPTTLLERLLFMVGGIALLIPEGYTDFIGLGLVLIGLLSQIYIKHIPIIGVRPMEKKA